MIREGVLGAARPDERPCLQSGRRSDGGAGAGSLKKRYLTQCLDIPIKEVWSVECLKFGVVIASSFVPLNSPGGAEESSPGHARGK